MIFYIPNLAKQNKAKTKNHITLGSFNIEAKIFGLLSSPGCEGGHIRLSQAIPI